MVSAGLEFGVPGIVGPASMLFGRHVAARNQIMPGGRSGCLLSAKPAGWIAGCRLDGTDALSLSPSSRSSRNTNQCSCEPILDIKSTATTAFERPRETLSSRVHTIHCTYDGSLVFPAHFAPHRPSFVSSDTMHNQGAQSDHSPPTP